MFSQRHEAVANRKQQDPDQRSVKQRTTRR